MVIIKTETMSNFLKALSTVPSAYVSDITKFVSEILDCLDITETSRKELRDKLSSIENEATSLLDNMFADSNEALEKLSIKGEQK